MNKLLELEKRKKELAKLTKENNAKIKQIMDKDLPSIYYKQSEEANKINYTKAKYIRIRPFSNNQVRTKLDTINIHSHHVAYYADRTIYKDTLKKYYIPCTEEEYYQAWQMYNDYLIKNEEISIKRDAIKEELENWIEDKIKNLI